MNQKQVVLLALSEVARWKTLLNNTDAQNRLYFFLYFKHYFIFELLPYVYIYEKTVTFESRKN